MSFEKGVSAPVKTNKQYLLHHFIKGRHFNFKDFFITTIMAN